MGNHARRSAVAKIVKAAGLGRLYIGTKREAWRAMSAGYLKELERKLSIRPGDLVNDCDGFNHVVRGRRDDGRLTVGMKSVSVVEVSQFEFEDGRWSCGCPTSPDPPETREAIEASTLRYLSTVGEDEWQYHGKRGRDRLEALRRGEHVCDERGILLPEFSDT